MLIPLTRETFQELIPAVATGAQYKYFWGKPPD
ncbi:MAG: phosphate ABC transporter permease, partial [Oscillatoriales cyanobacterium]